MNGFVGEGPRRLLIVEDEVELRQDMVQYFECKGFEVTGLGTAMEAVSLLQSGKDWDFLITDYTMPGMNGSDLINWCSIWKIKVTRSVLLTESPRPQLRNEKGIREFGTTILSKPIAMNDLHRILIDSHVETA